MCPPGFLQCLGCMTFLNGRGRAAVLTMHVRVEQCHMRDVHATGMQHQAGRGARHIHPDVHRPVHCVGFLHQGVYDLSSLIRIDDGSQSPEGMHPLQLVCTRL